MTKKNTDCKENDSTAILTPAQSKMARAALGLGIRDVAGGLGMSANTISRLERGEELKPETLKAIRAALEAAGVEFIAENGGGAGVRLRK